MEKHSHLLKLSLVLSFLLDLCNSCFTSFSGHNFSQLFLSDCVVRVWDKVFANFSQSKRNSRVALRRRPNSWDFNVQIVVQVSVLGIGGLTKLFFLKLKMHLWNSHQHYSQKGNFTRFLSFIDPRPRIAILQRVSSCNRLMEFPLGPRSFPTKLNFGCSLTGTRTFTITRICFSR